jgi:hypothetical protein
MIELPSLILVCKKNRGFRYIPSSSLKRRAEELEGERKGESSGAVRSYRGDKPDSSPCMASGKRAAG